MGALLEERGLGVRSEAFLRWLEEWHSALPAVSLREEILGAGGSPERVAVMVVDLLVGFCCQGPLASPRVGALSRPSAEFLQRCWDAGIRNLVLNTDSHPADSPEFGAFPPHCVTGTPEAEVIPELRSLPFFGRMFHVQKGSINVGHEPELLEWEAAHPEVDRWIVIGDCTDLCVYQTAMHLRLRANSLGRSAEVWVPADLVDTYHLPVEQAETLGALPHDAELLHPLFLYHMALNGIRIVQRIEV